MSMGLLIFFSVISMIQSQNYLNSYKKIEIKELSFRVFGYITNAQSWCGMNMNNLVRITLEYSKTHHI